MIKPEKRQRREEQPSPSRSVCSTHKSDWPPSPAVSSASVSASAVSPSGPPSPAGDKPSPACAVTTRSDGNPLSRRTHVKSRLGCFTCKRRRVKCNETRPVCSGCQRLGLRCGYPPQHQPVAEGDGSLIVAPGNSSANASSPVGGPQTCLPILTLQDLRFYHQFLTVGFPTLPLRADWIWPQCAAMSHQVRKTSSGYCHQVLLIMVV